jgi:signal transduction histidine kinase
MAVVALVTDLTAQKDNAALVAARDALQRADRQKDEFLAMLAHELRNPLAPIRNTVSLLQAARARLGVAPGLEVIERQVEHMALLLDDLLDVSQLTRGGMRAAQAAGGAAGRSSTLAIETSAPVIAAAGHELLVSLPERRSCSTPTAAAVAGLSNVLNNAAKYTTAAGASALERRARRRLRRVRIRDTGIGIARGLGHDLRPLLAGDAALDRSQGGLGIGLSLVRGLVELHGGTIEARSRGLGTAASS